MKRTIKVALINFWPSLKFEETVTYKILTKHFNVIVDNKDPDFVFASLFGDPRLPLKYKCPRIHVIGEPQTTDFSLYDYGIGFDFITIDDKNSKNRYFRFPVAFWEWHNELAKSIETPVSREQALEALSSKTSFCNFIYGYETSSHAREKVLETVGLYKHVDCCGVFKNNMPGGFHVRHSLEKVEYQKKYKFTIAGENILFPGLVTEKIIHAFFSNTIPIYVGDPLIGRTFNTKAFINANDYSQEELINEIRRIDNNDELFVQMLMQSKYAFEGFYNKIMNDYENFLLYIFNQKPLDAIRRQNAYYALYYERAIIQKKFRKRKRHRRFLYKKTVAILRRLKKVFV